MKLKSLIWTTLIATLLFFTLVYLGIKYDWVKQSSSSESTITKEALDGVQREKTSSLLPSNLIEKTTGGNGVLPELLGEEPLSNEGQQLGTSELTIDEVVTQCQSMAVSVGIPEQQLDQAILECVNRNSSHLTAEVDSFDEQNKRLIASCNQAITQRDLLSDIEVKLLIDECVASMQSQ